MQNPSLSLYVLAAIIFFSSIIWPGCKKKDEPSEDSVDTRTPKSRTKPKPQLPPRTTDPTFSPEVPADVRNIITALLAAYHRGDGESAYACLNTSRKEFRIANAFGTTQIPIMNAKVSLSNEDQVMIEYEMPHPGDIIAVILRGGENVDAIKKGLDALRSVEDCLKKTENWSVVRAGNIV